MFYFTADLHFEDKKILEITHRGRDFSDIGEHNGAMLEGINSSVGYDDTLIVVGDFATETAGQSLIEHFTGKIRCRYIHLVRGNHDPWSYRHSTGFRSAEEHMHLSLSAGDIYFHHHPMLYWPGSHRGVYHGYGHVHALREETIREAFPNARCMDVGVDNAKRLLGQYVPFSENEFFDICRPFSSTEHHDPVQFYRDAVGDAD